MTATVAFAEGALSTRSGDRLAKALATMSETDRNVIADAAERRIWGSTSYVPGVGNRRMLATGSLRTPTDDPKAAPTREDGRSWLQSFEVGRFGPAHIGRWVF